MDLASAPASIGPALQEAWPEVLQTVRIDPLPEFMLSFEDKRFFESGIVAVDPAILAVFDFSLHQGDATTALKDPNSIVITQRMARRYFGDSDPMGQVLAQFSQPYRVTGVIGEPPGPSHIEFDALVPFRVRQVQQDGEHMMGVYTYVLLAPGADAAALERRWPAFLATYPGARYHRDTWKEASQFRPHLQPLRDIHWRSHLADELAPSADPSTLALLAALAGLILGIACINYANLSTAQFARRGREVGVRKVMGAVRLRLAGQFVAEALILAVAALLVALVLVEMALPWYEGYLGKPLQLAPLGQVLLWPSLVLVVLVAGLGAGAYPALGLASLPPTQALRGTGGGADAGIPIRRALVTLQFALSTGLLAGTAGMFLQMRAVAQAPLGFDKKHVIVLSDRGTATKLTWANPNTDFAAQLRRSPAIEAVTACSEAPGRRPLGRPSMVQLIPTGRSSEEVRALPVIYVDPDYLRVLRLELVAGRNFSDGDSGDGKSAFILTQRAAQMLGWSAPLGQRLRTKGSIVEPAVEGEVIGVVRDFHGETLYEDTQPYVLRPHVSTRGVGPAPHQFSFSFHSERFIMARARPGRLAEAVEYLRQIWEQTGAPVPFEYHLLDDDFTRVYRAAHQQARLFAAASGVAIAVACFGLFGLASFAAQQRTREIGIRKVLGSSVGGIVLLLSCEYARLVLWGCLIACPVAYLGLRHWLEDFAYRATLGPGIFLAASSVTLALALLTAGWHAVRAALADPVDALRQE